MPCIDSLRSVFFHPFIKNYRYLIRETNIFDENSCVLQFELKEMKRREQEREEEERRKKEEAAAAEAARLAKATPVTSPDEPPSERYFLNCFFFFYLKIKIVNKKEAITVMKL